jgi:hypothetical protein
VDVDALVALGKAGAKMGWAGLLAAAGLLEVGFVRAHRAALAEVDPPWQWRGGKATAEQVTALLAGAGK